MFKVEAIVSQDKFEEVKGALNTLQISGVTAYQVMGCGAQLGYAEGYTENVRGTMVDINMLPKIKFEIVVPDHEWEQKVIDTIQQAAYTGNIGDGKIFSYEIRNAMRIRTKETGKDAI